MPDIRKPQLSDSPESWPDLPLSAWKDTRDTLHMWMQIVGKVRLELTPVVNHWWNVPLYVTPRGLATSAMPYRDRTLNLLFDFIDHRLVLEMNDGSRKSIPLAPRTVADFYHDVMAMLHAAGIDLKIWRMPVEIPNPIPFDEDRIHAFHRQEQPGSFLLGKLRLGRQPFFWTPRPRTPERRQHHPRSLLARSQQRRLVVRRRRSRCACLLFLHEPRTRRLQNSSRAPNPSSLSQHAK